MEQLPNRPPDIQISVGGEPFTLTHRETLVRRYLAEGWSFMNHLWVEEEETSKVKLIFGVPNNVLVMMVDSGYQSEDNELPDDQDKEWYAQYASEMLDQELEEFYGSTET